MADTTDESTPEVDAEPGGGQSESETETTPVDVAGVDDRWDDWENALVDLYDELDELVEDDDGGIRGGPAIPVSGSHVNLSQLHPELRRRVAAGLADGRVSALARVSSGVRTYDQQVYLFKLYGSGRAANPDYVGGDGRRGSKHMVQSASWVYAAGIEAGSYGYAVDIGFWPGVGTPWEQLRSVLGEYGLRLTVFSPVFEPWHFEIDPSSSGPSGTAAVTFQTSTLAKNDTGEQVRQLQAFLAERHAITPNTVVDPGEADGEFGDDTDASVRSWQKVVGLKPDGLWGPNTWRRTERFKRLRNRVLELNSRGQAVRTLQRYLKDRRSEAGVVLPKIGKADGDFGTSTEAAVKAWQGVLGIEADGVWGPATWEASDRYDDANSAEGDDVE